MNTRVVSAALAACAVVSACSLGAVGRRGDERIDLEVVPVPSVVAGERFPWFSSDGQRILFSGKPDGSSRIELLSIRDDGSDYRCLTCGTATEVTDPLLKPIPFSDNRRVLVRVGEQSPVKAADHAIVECRPTVTECTHAELVPIVIPSAGNAVVLQDQREFRVAPDGMHVGFTQVRATATGEGGFVAVVASLVRTAAGYELRDARVVSTRGELKDFTPDAKAVLVAAFTTSPYEAANPDVLRIDLRTGTESRVTSDPDYDEDLKFSPNGHWYVVGSGRTAGLFETVSQLKRPNFIGSGIEPLTAALFVQHRADVIEPWLVRTGTEQFGARGRLLNPGSPSQGYDGRAIMSWHPDGTRIIFWEGSSDPSIPPDRGRASSSHASPTVDPPRAGRREPRPTRPGRQCSTASCHRIRRSRSLATARGVARSW